MYCQHIENGTNVPSSDRGLPGRMAELSSHQGVVHALVRHLIPVTKTLLEQAPWQSGGTSMISRLPFLQLLSTVSLISVLSKQSLQILIIIKTTNHIVSPWYIIWWQMRNAFAWWQLENEISYHRTLALECLHTSSNGDLTPSRSTHSGCQALAIVRKPKCDPSSSLSLTAPPLAMCNYTEKDHSSRKIHLLQTNERWEHWEHLHDLGICWKVCNGEPKKLYAFSSILLH